MCEDAASATLTSALLASAIEELRVIGEHIFSTTSEDDTEEEQRRTEQFGYIESESPKKVKQITKQLDITLSGSDSCK